MSVVVAVVILGVFLKAVHDLVRDRPGLPFQGLFGYEPDGWPHGVQEEDLVGPWGPAAPAGAAVADAERGAELADLAMIVESDPRSLRSIPMVRVEAVVATAHHLR